ncbi:RNA-binding protein NOB1 [Podospora conica]|nr:RNA-binding protein NOB1 [Schizothecium conicum]
MADTIVPATPEAVEVPNPAPAITTPATPTKPVHSLVVDTNAIITNNPTISSLIAQAEALYTIPSVVAEIRDEAARNRYQTQLAPFITLRQPRSDSIRFIEDFARRTGDLQVLSGPDIRLLALTYELELERNNGDWRLRKDPTQKRVNGKPPGRAEESQTTGPAKDGAVTETPEQADNTTPPQEDGPVEVAKEEPAPEAAVEAVEEKLGDLTIEPVTSEDVTYDEVEASTSEDDDSGGEWITPSNIKKHQARENTSKAPQPAQKTLQAALITGDMAMRNVALRVNLNLLDSGFSRVTMQKTWVLRCHGCYKVCKDTSKQFCPTCGQPTLTRVSCTTDAAGNFTLHLKKNFQINKRGNVFSIPKPTHGTANGKQANVKGGGKNGWGTELILAEDQKEYQRRQEEDRRTRYRDLMDDDYLPSILTGQRTSGNGRIKVGAGRNINGKKKR